MLAGLAASSTSWTRCIVVDNASTDHTKTVLDGDRGPAAQVIRPEENLGGAGGFHRSEAAVEQGFDRIWLMDDDVVPAPDCLGVLIGVDEDCLMAVREDTNGRLVEKAAVRFDLRNPLAIRPKTTMVETTYRTRAAMPELVAIENVAFEGFMVRREVVDADRPAGPLVLHLLRRRRLRDPRAQAGFRIFAVRDAVLVRQLDFDQQHDGRGGRATTCTATCSRCTCGTARTGGPGEAVADRGDVLLTPFRGGRGEARNVRALRDAKEMR